MPHYDEELEFLKSFDEKRNYFEEELILSLKPSINEIGDKRVRSNSFF